ncbi:MAG: CvpA family protein [Rhodobiaceae bacterium]|nr:CvpA family protein [Rhodobiaceae bacterium]MCC0056520.1 CvpA family protein [Rhodobiaceae bacterium]
MFITGLDVILLVVMLISALLAMVRGMTREVLSIAAWVAGAVATIYFFPMFKDIVRANLQPNWLADIILALGIFIGTLVVVSFVTMRLSDFILDSRIGPLDRTLGFVFGLFRGLLLVVIAFVFFDWLVPPQTQPGWIKNARSAPMLRNTGDKIIAMLPDDPESAILQKLKERVGGMESDNGQDAPAEQDSEEKPGDPGYRDGQRRGLNQLLEGTQGNSN